MEKQILKKTCPRCRKVIKSLYEGQLDYNFKAHQLSCEKKIRVKFHISKDKNGNNKDNKKPVEENKI